MATFIMTVRFTEQGIKAINETTKRSAAFDADVKKMGVKVLGNYWTLGKYDGFLVFEAPDDETAAAVGLKLGVAGNVQTSTTRAFTAAEMEKILAKKTG